MFDISMSQSQTSFLEEVVQWNSYQCEENLTQALPRLIKCFEDTNIFQEQVGILQIICQSFLPCVDIPHAESKVYNPLITKICVIYDLIQADLLRQVQITRGGESVQTEKFVDILQLLQDVLDCCECCVTHAQRDDTDIQLGDVHSIPQGAIHILKQAYGHCKESCNIYGDQLTLVSGQLSSLFKKAHNLQVAFLHLLERLKVGSVISEQEVQDLCTICEGLFDVCQLVTSLDIKLLVTLWKAISKQASLHKDHLKTRLNVGAMVCYLCSEIRTGYLYLFQLLPQVDSEGLSLSQGDEKGFQKSVKILGFQMKICAMLIREYSDYVCDCEAEVFELLILLHRSLPPCLAANNIQPRHEAEIRRQILNATDSVLMSLLTNRVFRECLLSSEKDEGLPHLLLLMKAMDRLPRFSDEDRSKWMAGTVYNEDVQTHTVIGQVFRLTEKCKVEIGLPVYLPEPMSEGKPQNMSSLYHHICVHLCGFIGSLPAVHFQKLEDILIENLFSTDYYTSLLAMDIWCFIARYGTPDLCVSHVEMLMMMYKEIPELSISQSRLILLVNRLLPFVTTQHQKQLFSKFPLESYFPVWMELRIQSLASCVKQNIVSQLVNKALEIIQQFIDAQAKHAEIFISFNRSLRCILNMTSMRQYSDSILTASELSRILHKLCQLWASISTSDWLSVPLCQVALGYLFQISALLIEMFTNSDLIKVFSVISCILQHNSIDFLKISFIKFLQNCGKLKLTPCSEQYQIISKLPEMFVSVLSDNNVLVHQMALQAFTQFAEETNEESLVTQCIQSNSQLQNRVVNYLNKVPSPCDIKRQEFLANQKSCTENILQSTSSWPYPKRAKIIDSTEYAETSLTEEKQNEPEEMNGNVRFHQIKSQAQKLLGILKQCVSELEDSITSSGEVRSHLKTAQIEIGKFLEENG